MLNNVSVFFKKRFTIYFLLIITLTSIVWMIKVMDETPRTDNAYVYADTINLAPEVNGRIIELPVKENQLVKKGDLLFRIDPTPFVDKLIRAKASLEELEQQIILMERTVESQKYNAQAAAKRVSAAQATAEQDASTLRRLEALNSNNYVSKESLDKARAAKRVSESQLNSARLEAEQAKAAISSIDALVAQREVIKADISIAELDLKHTNVQAPFDGRVVSLKTTTGQYASVGQPIFTLIDSSNWFVIANFREADLVNIKANSDVIIYLMGDTKRKFSGIVESIGFGVYPDDGGATREGLPDVSRTINWVRVAQRFPVRIRVINPDGNLFRIGASAVVSINSKETAIINGVDDA